MAPTGRQHPGSGVCLEIATSNQNMQVWKSKKHNWQYFSLLYIKSLLQNFVSHPYNFVLFWFEGSSFKRRNADAREHNAMPSELEAEALSCLLRLFIPLFLYPSEPPEGIAPADIDFGLLPPKL